MRSWPARARSACSPPRRCARAARTCACSIPTRAARGARPSWASARPRAGERFAGALLTAPAALPEALRLLEPGGQLVLFSGGAEQPLDTDLVYRRELDRARPALVDAAPSARGARADRRRRRRLREPRRLRPGLDAFDDGLARYRSRAGAQGGVRTVIAARYWAPRDVRVEHVAEPEPRAGEVRAARRGGADLRHRREVLPARASGAARARARAVRPRVRGRRRRARRGRPVRGGRPRVRRQLGALRRRAAPAARGREELCSDLYPLLNGAYAELLCVPAHIARVNLHRVPEGVAAEVAAAIEPLACAVHGADDADVRAGPAHRHPRPRPARAPARVRLRGARRDAPSCSAAARASRAATRRVIEAAGTPEAWEQAIALAAPGGTVVLFGGLPRETVVPVDSYRLHYEALTLRGSFHHRPRDVRAALGLLARAAPVDREAAHARVRARRRGRAARARRGPRAARRPAEGGDPPVKMFASQLRRLPVNDPLGRAHRARARHRRDDAAGRAAAAHGPARLGRAQADLRGRGQHRLDHGGGHPALERPPQPAALPAEAGRAARARRAARPHRRSTARATRRCASTTSRSRRRISAGRSSRPTSCRRGARSGAGARASCRGRA